MATENDSSAEGSLTSTGIKCSIDNAHKLSLDDGQEQDVVLQPNADSTIVEDELKCSTSEEDHFSQSRLQNDADCLRDTDTSELGSSHDVNTLNKIPTSDGDESMPLSEATSFELVNEIQIRDEKIEADSDAYTPLENQDMQTDFTSESKSVELEEDLKDSDQMMGYDFTEDGRLCDKDGEPFKFDFYEDKSKNQERYERLGEAITEKIYELLETKCNLKKLNLPLGVGDDEPHSFIFLSEKALETTDRLLILIHGSGVVRAGQWARRLIINDDLNKGTQIPYIMQALSEGYQVIVLNTNRNRWPDGGANAEPIPENDDPESHASYVWNNVVVKQSKAQHIAVVAHSYGGVVTTHLLEQEMEEFTKRVFAVAFTDSVHSLGFKPVSGVYDFYKKYARNYVTSDLPVGEPLPLRFVENAERVSAGHTKHEWTSYSSMESVFSYLQEKYKERLSRSSGDVGASGDDDSQLNHSS